MSSHLLCVASHLFQEESQAITDERKDHHRTVDESSSEQQIHESDDYIWIVRKNWSPKPSATGSCGRLGGCEMNYG